MSIEPASLLIKLSDAYSDVQPIVAKHLATITTDECSNDWTGMLWLMFAKSFTASTVDGLHLCLQSTAIVVVWYCTQGENTYHL